MESSAQKFQVIQKAYDVLSNPTMRAEYDKTRNDSKSKGWSVARKGMVPEEVSFSSFECRFLMMLLV